MAARKADEFISCLIRGGDHTRKKFSFTWNGEYRIKNCKKIDLVGAYRLVLIQKDSCFIFLYAGSHDDCFRWIERNKGLSYEVDQMTHAINVILDSGADGDVLPEDVLEEKRFVEQYEQRLMKQVDDDLITRVFSGWCRSDQDGDCKPAI
jgi:hypothetical protein